MNNQHQQQIKQDSHCGAHVRGTHVGIFDISGELPKITSSGYSVISGSGKSIVWLKDLAIKRGVPHTYMLIDHRTIREDIISDERVDRLTAGVEIWKGHACFNTWWKHRLMAEVSRNFDVRVPTFKDGVDIDRFHTVLYMINLPVFRMITAAIAINVLTYNDLKYNEADCINLFFKRYPSLEKHRRRVELALHGNWLEPLVEAYKQGDARFNVNQLTGV